MKEYPFEQRGIPQYMLVKYRMMFDEVRSQVMDRLKGRSSVRDRRVGFGTIAAAGDLRRGGLTLSLWNWRDADPEQYPAHMEATMFADDPLAVPPDTPLGRRMLLAEKFVEVVADMFDPKVTLKPHAIEIVAAGPDRPPGIERGDATDIMSIELYEGVPMPRIIDRLVQMESDRVGPLTELYAGHFLQFRLWHRAERINAARAMLGRDLPPIRIPGMSALDRRIEPLNDAKHERLRAMHRDRG